MHALPAVYPATMGKQRNCVRRAPPPCITDLFLDHSLANEYTTRTGEEQRNFTGMVRYLNARVVRNCKWRKYESGTEERRLAFLRMGGEGLRTGTEALAQSEINCRA